MRPATLGTLAMAWCLDCLRLRSLSKWKICCSLPSSKKQELPLRHGMDLGTDSSFGCDFELLRYSQPGGCAEALDAWALLGFAEDINQQVYIKYIKIPQMTCGTFCGFWPLRPLITAMQMKLPRISVNFMTRTFIGAFSACPGLLLRILGAN